MNETDHGRRVVVTATATGEWYCRWPVSSRRRRSSVEPFDGRADRLRGGYAVLSVKKGGGLNNNNNDDDDVVWCV